MDDDKKSSLDIVVAALTKAAKAVWNLPCKDAVKELSQLGSEYQRYQQKFGTPGILLDFAPEEIIVRELLANFPNCVIATEEAGRVGNGAQRMTSQNYLFAVDPFDRSKPAQKRLLGQEGLLGEVLARNKELFPYRACTSVAALKGGIVEFSATLDYETGDVYVCSNQGAFLLSGKNAHQLAVRGIGDKVAAYMGYPHSMPNLARIGLDKVDYATIDSPGGPMRILGLLYDCGLGAVLANGEKLAEWIGWMPYARQFKELSAFEFIYHPALGRKGITVSPSAENSIFSGDGINVGQLERCQSPTLYFATVLVCRNDWKHFAEVSERAEHGQDVRRLTKF